MTDDLTQEYGTELGTANEQLRTLLTSETDVVETPGVTVSPDPNDPEKTITTVTEPLPRRTELVGDGGGQVQPGRVTESETVTDQPIVSIGGKTAEGRPILKNPDGSISTERSITVTDERINGGKPTNIPSMFGGNELSEDAAIQRIVEAGGKDPETGRALPGFDTVQEAVDAAVKRSEELGKQNDQSQTPPQGRFTVTDHRINSGQPTPFDSLKDAQKAAGTPDPLAKIEETVGVSPLEGVLKTAEQKDAAKNFVDLLNIPVEHLAGFITKGDVTQTATPDELGAQILAPVVGKLGELLDEKQLGMLTTAVGILGMAVIDPMNPALAAGQVAKAAGKVGESITTVKNRKVANFEPGKEWLARHVSIPESKVYHVADSLDGIVKTDGEVSYTVKNVPSDFSVEAWKKMDNGKYMRVGRVTFSKQKGKDVIDNLAVSPSEQRKGIATNMIGIAEEARPQSVDLSSVYNNDISKQGAAFLNKIEQSRELLAQSPFKEAVDILKSERGSFQPVPGSTNPYGSSYSTKKQAGASKTPIEPKVSTSVTWEEAIKFDEHERAFNENLKTFDQRLSADRGGVQSDVQVFADSISPDALDMETFLKLPPGTILKTSDIVAAKRLFNDLTIPAIQLAKVLKKNPNDFQALLALLEQMPKIDTGLTKIAGVFAGPGRQQRILAMDKPVEGMIKADTPERVRISQPYIKQWLDFFQAQQERVEMGLPGLTPDKLVATLADMKTPEEVMAAAKVLSQPGFWDMWLENWVNGLLSGLAPVKSLMGNPVVLAGQIATRGVAAGIDSIGTGMVRFIEGGQVPRDVYMGEVGQMLYGAVEAMGDGFLLAWKALKENQPQMRGQSVEPFRVSATSEYLNMTGIMGRMTDYVTSASGRFLLAGDELAKAMAYRAELRALALRKAYTEVYTRGLQGVEAANHVQMVKRQVLSNPLAYPAIHKQAEDFALYVALQKELGEAGKTIQHMASNLKLDKESWIGAFPVGRFLLTFTTIAINSPKMVGEYTGLAKATIMQEIAAGGARKDIALAKLATGTAFMTVLAGLAAQGLITGTGPRNQQAKQQWMDETKKMPNAFWDPISEKYRSTAGLEPYNTIMGAVADIVDIYSHAATETIREKASAAIEALAIGLSNNIGSKSYLKGAAGSMNAVVTGDVQSFEQYAKRTVPGMVTPYSGALRQIEQGIDPVTREALDMIDALKKDIPGLSETLPPELNGLGRIIIRDGGFWNPFYAGVGTPEDQEVLAVLDQHGVILPKVKPMIDGVPLNVWEYHAYQEFATKGLAQDLKGALVGQGALTDRDVERVTASIVNAHHTEGKWAFLESQAVSDKTRTRLNEANKRREAGERMTPSPFLPGRLPSGTTAPGGLTR